MANITTRGSWLYGYTTRTTLQLLTTSNVNSDHILRGIHGGKTLTSLIIKMGKVAQVFLSTFGNGISREKSEYYSTSSLEILRSLIPGCKFTDGDLELEIKKYSALIVVVGHPHIGYKGQTNEMFNGLTSVGINATIILNIKPLTIRETQPIQPQPPMDTPQNLDCAFLSTYSIFLTDNDPDLLTHQAKTILTLLGSIFESEHSKLSVAVESDGKAVRTLEDMIWGDLSYSPTVLTIKELIAYMQLPVMYGIDESVKPEIYVPPPTSFQVEGGIELGMTIGQFDEEIYPAFFDPNTIFQNTAIWGTIGYGKSTSIYNLITKLHNQKRIGILALDFHNEYRKVVPSLNGEVGKDILVLNPYLNQITLNPLEIPDGLSDRERSIAISETVEAFIHILKNQLDWVIGEVQDQRCRKHLYELFENSNCPTIGQLIKLLEKDKLTKIKQDEDNLPLKLSKFSTGPYGETFNQPHTNLPLEQMESCTSIIELGKWPIELRSFFSIVLLNRWWTRRLAQNPQTAKPHVLVLDEFHHYDNLPITRKILSEGRKYKQGVICSHQGPFQITDKALLGDLVRNTVTKIVFRQMLRQDIEIILGSIGLHDMKWRDYLTRMEIGEAIVSLQGIPQPFRIKTPPFEQSQSISDEVVKEKHNQILTVPTAESVAVESGMGNLEKEFLQLVHDNQYSTTSDIVSHMRIMRSEGYNLKSQLVEEGLVLEESVRTGRGRPKKILKLTEDAYALLGIEHEGTPAHYGGDEHQHMIERIADVLCRNGWAVVIESDWCDIKANNRTGTKVAIEVETCKAFNEEQIIKNIEKNLKWADKVFFVAPNVRDKEKIQNLAKAHGFEKVDVLTYSDLDHVNTLFRLTSYSKYMRENPEAVDG